MDPSSPKSSLRFAIPVAVVVIGVAFVFLKPKPTSNEQVPTAEVSSPAIAQSPSEPVIASQPSATPTQKVFQLPPDTTADDRKKIELLEQILTSKNDNDPRLDSEFRNLTPTAKAALRAKYSSLAPESRNERGAIVFLLGRELKSPEDVTFVSSVVSEPPCLSMEDCSHRPRGTDEHAAVANEVSVVYPQLVAVKSLERLFARGGPTPELRKPALDALAAAEKSENSKISQAARDVLSRIQR